MDRRYPCPASHHRENLPAVGPDGPRFFASSALAHQAQPQPRVIGDLHCPSRRLPVQTRRLPGFDVRFDDLESSRRVGTMLGRDRLAVVRTDPRRTSRIVDRLPVCYLAPRRDMATRCPRVFLELGGGSPAEGIPVREKDRLIFVTDDLIGRGTCSVGASASS